MWEKMVKQLEKLKSKLFVGTSGYYFRDWVGVVYPKNLKKSTDYLKYYVDKLQFSTVELNYTFYRMPDIFQIKRFVDLTPKDFVFSLKANNLFTHAPFVGKLTEDEKWELLKEIENGIDEFKKSLKPMVESGKLFSILFQFPIMFLPEEKSFRYLKFIKKSFTDFPIAFEFRSENWGSSSYIEFLRELEVSWVITDLPKIPKLLPMIPISTNRKGYVRLHGRNKEWFKVKGGERYNYNYSDEELKEIINLIEGALRESERSVVYFNNCHHGNAVLNALRFIEIL